MLAINFDNVGDCLRLFDYLSSPQMKKVNQISDVLANILDQ